MRKFMETGLAVSLTLLAFGCKPKVATTGLKSEDTSGYQCDEYKENVISSETSLVSMD